MMDRPRRSTRNSLYNNTPPTNATPSSNVTASAPPGGGNNNPYKKPTYLAGRPPPPDLVPISTPTRGRGRGRGRPARNGSCPPASGQGQGSITPATGGGRGRPSSRPECVAPRVESRRSTGGSGSSASINKKKKRGAYNSQDYHYGSDFSDQNDSDGGEGLDERLPSGSESPSELGRDDADSDSDFSIGSSKPNSSSLPAISRPSSPPIPLWMDSELPLEELELPKSSDDLLVDRDLVMRAVAVYEPLRRFHQLVRLSPFRFEDFCAALGSDETSSLLTEIHIQLLRTILREEEVNGTLFGPLELKDSIAAVLFFIDSLTWPECLRSYVESDPKWGEIHSLISSVEYPYGNGVGAEMRLKVLSWMVDQFLATGLVRDSLQLERIRHDDYCRACNKFGEVLMCETCPAVYHLYCITPPYKSDEVPPDDWQCPVCVKHSVPGIGDCASDLEKAGLLIRHEKLGIDRHGRKYWFLIRRVLVESEDGSSVWYYSTPLQVEELLYRLDEEGYESELVENIKNAKDEIVRQMEVTESITDDANGFRRKTYIDAENTFLKNIHEDRKQAHIKEIEDSAKEAERAIEAQRLEEERKLMTEEEVKVQKEAEMKRIREERLLRRNQNKFTDYNPADWVDGQPHSSSSEPDSGGESKVNHCDEREIKGEESATHEEMGDKSQDVKKDNETPAKLTASQIEQADTQVIGSPEIAASSKTKEIKETPEEVKVEEMEQDSSPDKSKDLVPAITLPKKEENNYDDLFVKVEKSLAPTQPPSRRKSKALLLDWDTEERMTRLKATGLYKLGQEGNYRSYVNVYNVDNFALSKFQHGEESNKKRQLSHKFSLTPASEVKWASFSNSHSAGQRSNLISCLRGTLLHLEAAVPGTLMHINWTTMKKAWLAAVSSSSGARDFSKAIISLAACLRPCVFNPIWSEGVGHHKLIRTSALEREERKKAEKRDKKDRDDEEDRLRLLPQFVKYSIPPKHQVFKQKGEEYRVHGRWGWIWMSKLRRCQPSDSRKLGLLAGPHKHVIQVKNDTGTVKTILIDPTVFNKLMAKRSLSQKGSGPATPSATKPQNSSVETKVEKMDVDETDKKANEEDDRKEIKAEGEEHVVPKNEDETTHETTTRQNTTAVEEENSKTNETAATAAPEIDSPMDVEDAAKVDVGNASFDDSVPPPKDETSKAEKELIPKPESEDEPPVPPVVPEEEGNAEPEPFKTEVKEDPEPESSAQQPTKPSDGPLPPTGGLGVGRKFRTDLVNVSLGIVSANRILYPKIAHKSVILENLLVRRVALQQREEAELLETYGKEKLDTVQSILDNGGKIPSSSPEEEINNEPEEVLDDTFPLAGIYRYKCYSYMCQSAAEKFRSQNTTTIRQHEFACYSPMCRLKFYVQDSNRRKEERVEALRTAKLAALVDEVVSKRMFTQTESSAKILLKPLPHEIRNRARRAAGIVKYPLTSTFKAGWVSESSIFVLPPHELTKLARTAGRYFTPTGFAPAPKTGTWAWPYPCGRASFKTTWQFKTVHASTLAAAALQLRILWASVKWDDIQMKAPNHDGISQITTDMEIITSEILDHRVVGRFQERVQYLLKKTVEPIDAPKTIREVTPSRSGLRKRKLAESLAGCDPVITEEWVDEDRLELWEIKVYHDRLEHPGRYASDSTSSKSGSPSTRTKSGVTIRIPEKYDPSPGDKDGRPLSAAKAAELMETELKMQRAVHLSKRDNHAKAANNPGKVAAPPTLTASQQLQQQQAAAGLATNPRSYGVGGSTISGKKVTVVTTKTHIPASESSTTPTTPAAILNRKSNANAISIPKVQPGSGPPVQQKITVFRTSDGKLQVQGLLPGQSVYQTADGKLGLTGTPIRPLQPQKLVTSLPTPTATPSGITPQSTGQTILIQSSDSGQLQSSAPAPPSSSASPLINISSTMRTVLASSTGSGAIGVGGGNTIRLLSSSASTPPQQIHTYSKNIRKVNPKLPGTPTAIAPATSGQQVTGTLNSAGQIVLTRGGQVIQGINSQGQIVIASGGGQSQGVTVPGQSGQGTIVVSSGNTLNPNNPVQPSTPSSSGGAITIGQSPGPGVAIATHQPGGRVMIQDGNRTIVVSGGANLTPAQLQQILAMNLKKPGTPTTGKQHIQIQQVPKPSGVQQQIAIQPSPQQPGGQMQIIQAAPGQGQQVQIISGGQNIQQIAAGGQAQGQIILQNLPTGLVGSGGHQITTIGGQNVIVKKIVKGPPPPGSIHAGIAGVPVTISAAPGTPMPSVAQIQALLSSHKNLIRVDPKTGVMNISSATLAQLQQQQLLAQQQGSIQSSSTSGSTTVTKTPGLPISIVSPSKTTKIVPTLFGQQQPGALLSSEANVKTISSMSTPLVSPSSSSSRLIAPAAAASPQKAPASPLIVAKNPESQQIASTISSPAAVAPATPRPGGQIPAKIAAQFVETSSGPRVLVSGFKPGDLSQAQLANLNAQIYQQLQEHPQLKEKFKALGDNFSEMKIILQPHPIAIPPSPSSPGLVPSPAKMGRFEQPPISPLLKSGGSSSPTKFLSSSTTKVTKSLASPITHSAASGLTLGAKSPPNSANIDAAIDAVASDVNAPVVVPQGKSSPKKFISMPSLSPTSSPCPSKEDMLKNIMAKTEAAVVPPVVKSPSPKKKSPKKTPTATLTQVLEPCSSVPLPDEEADVVISCHDDNVANEVEISENKGEIPRFVLSQDLVGQAGQKSIEQTASSMTFFSSGQQQQQQRSSHGMANNQSEINLNSGPPSAQKSGSSRRKSPVKVKQMQSMEPSSIASPPKKRIAMSPIANAKQMAALNKHTEYLRKDMSKKRSTLERGLIMDIRVCDKKEIMIIQVKNKLQHESLAQKEISQDHPEENELGGRLVIADDDGPAPSRAGGQKRKSSEGKASGNKRQKRNSSGKKPKPSQKIVCICQTPFDVSRNYVVCNGCSLWYHGDCVGVPEGEETEGFLCDKCKPLSAEADATGAAMCLCRQPYVVSQFCLACDKCDEWFHGRCVGILPKEGKAIPTYFCADCEPTNKIHAANVKPLTGVHYVEIGKIMRQIINIRCAQPFVNPVSKADAPNYYAVIKEPMDLKQINHRVDQKLYTNLKDFIGDLAKVFDNCEFFNPPESRIFSSGKQLDSFCSQKMKELREFVDKN